MALRNNCRLTAGKRPYSAGQGTGATGARNKKQSRRRFAGWKKEALMKALPKGQYIRHFQYGLGVITESNEQRTSIDFDIHGMKKFVTGLMAVDPAEGTPPKRSPPKRSKKHVTAPLPPAPPAPQATTTLTPNTSLSHP